MIRCSLDSDGLVVIEIDNARGKASAGLEPRDALSFRQRLDALLVEALQECIDMGDFEEKFA